MTSKHFVYMILCEGNTIYTGYSIDPFKRFVRHSQGKGAKYTKSHAPIKLLLVEECFSKSEALKKEYKLKALSHEEKLIYVSNCSQNLI